MLFLERLTFCERTQTLLKPIMYTAIYKHIVNDKIVYKKLYTKIFSY